MIKKKDTLIEQAEKIKAELGELEKKKKGLDSLNPKKSRKKQSGTCKGICKQFKAKRPLDGKRYEAGQMRCQICEIFIGFKGAHTKNGLPATKDSDGVYCNCCNYKVRKNPRNKIYKEKLRESKEGKQNERKDVIELDIDKINRLISESLRLIRKNSVGIYEKSLLEELKISDEEFQQILPRLLRLDDIIEEIGDWNTFSKKVLRSVKVKEESKPRIISKNISTNIPRDYNERNEIKNISNSS